MCEKTKIKKCQTTQKPDFVHTHTHTHTHLKSAKKFFVRMHKITTVKFSGGLTILTFIYRKEKQNEKRK